MLAIERSTTKRYASIARGGRMGDSTGKRDAMGRITSHSTKQHGTVKRNAAGRGDTKQRIQNVALRNAALQRVILPNIRLHNIIREISVLSKHGITVLVRAEPRNVSPLCCSTYSHFILQKAVPHSFQLYATL